MSVIKERELLLSTPEFSKISDIVSGKDCVYIKIGDEWHLSMNPVELLEVDEISVSLKLIEFLNSKNSEWRVSKKNFNKHLNHYIIKIFYSPERIREFE